MAVSQNVERAPNQGPPGRGLAASGVIWVAGGHFAGQGIRLAGNITLAYLLFEEAFGVMALVSAFMFGVNMFSDLGVWRSVAQSKNGDSESFLNTAWTIQAIRGVFIWLAIAVLAWPFADYYSEPMLYPYLLVVGASAVIQGLQSPSLLLRSRRVDLYRVTVLNLVAQVAALGVMITFAYYYRSVWSLVVGGVVSALVVCVGSHTWLSLYKPRFQWDRDARRELFRMGKWFFLSSSLCFLASQGDRLILGKLIEKDELGVFSIAVGITGIAPHIAGSLFNHVLFPILSRSQGDVDRLVGRFFLGRAVLLQVSACLCVATVIGAPLFFEVLYDERYVRAGWFAQWITISTWAAIMALGLEQVPLALGNARVGVWGEAIKALGLGLAIIGYGYYEIPGLIGGIAVALLLAQFVMVCWIPRRRMSVLWQSLRYTLVGASYLGCALALLAWSETRFEIASQVAATVFLAGMPLAIGTFIGLAQVRTQK